MTRLIDVVFNCRVIVCLLVHLSKKLGRTDDADITFCGMKFRCYLSYKYWGPSSIQYFREQNWDYKYEI